MTLNQEQPLLTGKPLLPGEHPHSGNLPGSLREEPVDPDGTPLVEQSAPDNASGLLGPEQDTIETVAATTDDAEVAAVTAPTPNRKKWHQRAVVRVAGAVLATSAITIPVAVAVAATHQEVGPQPGQPIPEPGSPNYDTFQKIGNNSEITIGDVDRLLTYFNSGEINRDALVTALAQANQQEVDRIFEVMTTPDAADNIEVTTILNKYGLETNEIPRDLMGSISEKNSLVEQDVDAIAFFYQDVPYEDLKAALADFTPEEAEITLAVISGTASLTELDQILQSHGIDVGGESVS